jgi:hypothetical protein
MNNETNNNMNKQQLKLEIEKLAKEESITFLQACSIMQSAALKMGSEKMISIIHEIKMDTSEMKALFS